MRVVNRLIGVAMVGVWLPLLVAGIASLRQRGPLGDTDILIVTGPYARVRHPLCAGLSMTIVGLGLVLGRLSLALGGSAWLLVTRLWSIHEEKALAERFGTEYAAYRDSTPAMVPNLGRLLRCPGRSQG
jgi:protein-S-isoprenylcysteine O-methyltransferase Ste14